MNVQNEKCVIVIDEYRWEKICLMLLAVMFRT